MEESFENLLEILQNEYESARIGRYELKERIKKLSDEEKEEILRENNRIKGLGMFISFDWLDIIKSMSDNMIIKILEDEELVTELELKKEVIIQLLNDDEKKEKMIIKYLTSPDEIGKTIQTFKSNEKIIIFIKEKKEFFQKKDITVVDIIRNINYNDKKNLEVVYRLDELGLTEGEKRLVLAGLPNKIKDKLDMSRIDSKYEEVLQMKLYEMDWNSEDFDFRKDNRIIPNLDEDLNKYRDLDSLLYIENIPLTEIEDPNIRKKIIELCKICPNVYVAGSLRAAITLSYGKEVVEAEEWIESVLSELKPEWTDIQKMAYIDNAIGKRVSFCPEQGTEVENHGDERALWRIIVDGEGVCNGISQITEYMYKRIGVESEKIVSPNHMYLLVKNVEIPTENGIIRGNTIVDSTWNLRDNRYGARPEHFCVSYEDIRKLDIDETGKDYECHKNDELEKMETISMDEESLRKVYTSIGIANERGKFPIGKLIDKIEEINKNTTNWDDNIREKFNALEAYCPEFADCINSTTGVIAGILFDDNGNLQLKRCIADRVYDKADQSKKAVLFTYFDLGEEGKRFFYADKEAGKFIMLSQEEFEKKFDCYEKDKEKYGGKTIWESSQTVQGEKATSSGGISFDNNSEGDGRE